MIRVPRFIVVSLLTFLSATHLWAQSSVAPAQNPAPTSDAVVYCQSHPSDPICQQGQSIQPDPLYCQTHLSDPNCQQRQSTEPATLPPTGAEGEVARPPFSEAPPSVENRQQRPASPYPFGMEAPSIVKKAQPPTEFQQFIADSLGKTLPVFGADLFDNVPSTFAPVDHAPVPVNYVIGPGDEINVRIWGMVSLNERTTVDRNGQIYLPKVGEISVAGVHYSDLEGHLRRQLERVFRDFEVSAALGRLRTIDVFVVGQARHPGTYTVSSLSTLVNALFASGGPTLQGSLRHIRLMREDKEISEFDLYSLLLAGDKSKDVPLLPGDVIYIPVAGPQVALSGSVNIPGIFELKESEDTLKDALELAGGLDQIADGSRVMLERIDDHHVRSVTEVSLTSTGFSQPVKGGDLIRVLSIVPRFSNAITLRGNVANPGRFSWSSGMRIRDLIPDQEMLLTRRYWRSSNATINSRTDYAVSEKNTTNTDISGIRTEIKIAVPEINWEYAVIQRLNSVDLSSKLIPFSLRGAILEKNDADNIELQPGDIVTIFSQQDLTVSQGRQTKFVRVEGEVKAPGIYRAQQNDTLSSLIQRAGGITENAYLFGTEFTRESARIQQQHSLDQLAKVLETEIQQKAISETNADPTETAAIAARGQSQKVMVDQLKATHAIGRVVLGIHPNDTSLDNLPPIIVEDGDAVVIPPRSATVSVVGAVYTQSSFLYQKDSNVSDYLRAAGSGTQMADMRHVLLVRANGSVIAKKDGFSIFDSNFRALGVLPGDTIVIPTKLESGVFAKALRDWTQITGQLALTAASLAVVSK